jgi:hypothetical protein
MSKAQLEIPGTERPVIKAIEDAAENYVAARDKRMKLTEQEVAAKDKLIEVMLKNADKLCVDGEGNKIYRFDEAVVILSDIAKVKVRHAHDEAEADED